MVEKTKKNDKTLRSQKFFLDQQIEQQSLGLSDEEINHIKRKLPDKKYYEFAYHMLFEGKFSNLDQEWKKWQQWPIWNYPIYDLNRFNKVIIENCKFIEHKRILDVGCSIGYQSLFCLNLGCDKVIGFDARKEKLNIADFICTKFGSDRHQFYHMDINDKTMLSSVSTDIDTILFSGVIYHVPNHYEILRNLSDSSAKTMIIENRDSHKFYDCQTPNVYWEYEPVSDTMNGYSEKHDQILIGKPNQVWINTAMKELGWKLIKTEHFYMNNKHPLYPRCASVFER